MNIENHEFSEYSRFSRNKYWHVYLVDVHLQSNLFTGSHFASWHYTCVIECTIGYDSRHLSTIILYHIPFWNREAHAPTSFLLKLRLILMY